jgi:hypothetical protein
VATPRLRDRHAREAAALDEQTKRNSRDSGTLPPATSSRVTAAGDSRRLRGLPCVARAVSGHIPGTDPVEALMSKYGDDGYDAF